MSSGQTPNLPNAIFNTPWIDPKTGMVTRAAQQILRDFFTGVKGALTPQAQIISTAQVQGRTDGIGTTVSNIDNQGIVLGPGIDLVRAYTNKDTDHINDGIGSPLAGGKRGYQALDTNNRLASTFNQTSVNTSNTPTGATSLANDGTTTAITVLAGQNRFAPTAISYNAGSVDPGVFGTFYVFADDPDYLGGAVTYQFTTDITILNAAEGRVNFGGIVTTGGTPGTGGGNTGGTSGRGGSGGRGFSPL